MDQISRNISRKKVEVAEKDFLERRRCPRGNSWKAPGTSTGSQEGVCMMVEGVGQLDYGVIECDRGSEGC